MIMGKNQILIVAILFIAIAYLTRIYPDQTASVLWSVLVGAALQWAYRKDSDTNTRT